MPFRGIDNDPLRNFKFRVTIGSAGGRTGFSKVSGLKESTEVVEYREGTDPATMRKLFGQTSYDNVTFEHGITNDPTLINWRRQITDVASGAGKGPSAEGDGNDEVRRNIAVDVIEYHGRSKAAWRFELLFAWPVTWELGELAGDGNDVLIESMEVAHEGLRITPP